MLDERLTFLRTVAAIGGWALLHRPRVVVGRVHRRFGDSLRPCHLRLALFPSQRTSICYSTASGAPGARKVRRWRPLGHGASPRPARRPRGSHGQVSSGGSRGTDAHLPPWPPPGAVGTLAWKCVRSPVDVSASRSISVLSRSAPRYTGPPISAAVDALMHARRQSPIALRSSSRSISLKCRLCLVTRAVLVHGPFVLK